MRLLKNSCGFVRKVYKAFVKEENSISFFLIKFLLLTINFDRKCVKEKQPSRDCSIIGTSIMKCRYRSLEFLFVYIIISTHSLISKFQKYIFCRSKFDENFKHPLYFFMLGTFTLRNSCFSILK